MFQKLTDSRREYEDDAKIITESKSAKIADKIIKSSSAYDLAVLVYNLMHGDESAVSEMNAEADIDDEESKELLKGFAAVNLDASSVIGGKLLKNAKSIRIIGGTDELTGEDSSMALIDYAGYFRS